MALNKHFRGCVFNGAVGVNKGSQGLGDLPVEAEIREFYLGYIHGIIDIYEDILSLQIVVDYTLAVTVVDSFHNLMENLASKVFSEASLEVEYILQVAIEQLHHDVGPAVLIRRFEHVLDFDDIPVLHLFQNIGLL